MEFRAVEPFIQELIRAAYKIDKLSKSDQARILRRAALTIRGYRNGNGFSGTPANDNAPGNVVHDLNEMARLIYLFGRPEVAAAMLNAVEVIKDYRAIIEAKQEGDGDKSMRHLTDE